MFKLIICTLISFILGLTIHTPSMMLGIEFNGYRITGNICTWLGCLLLCMIMVRLMQTPYLLLQKYHQRKTFKKQVQDKQFLIDIIQAYINHNTLLYPQLLERTKKSYPKTESIYWTIQALLAPSDRVFQHLCDYKDTILGGLHGLIKIATKDGDASVTQHLLDKISKENQKLPWVQKIYFQLSVQNNEWDQALEHLEKLKDIISPTEYQEQKAVCLYQLGQIRHAYRLDPNNPAIALEWAKHNPTLTCKIFNPLWQKHPNWMLYLFLKTIISDKSAKKQIQMIQKLIHKNPQHKLSLLALADIYLTHKDPIQAKECLDEYLGMYPLNHQIAQMMAQIERTAWNHEEIARKWESKTVETENDDMWKCEFCHNSFPTWHATCPICRHFNTLK